MKETVFHGMKWYDRPEFAVREAERMEIIREAHDAGIHEDGRRGCPWCQMSIRVRPETFWIGAATIYCPRPECGQRLVESCTTLDALYRAAARHRCADSPSRKPAGDPPRLWCSCPVNAESSPGPVHPRRPDCDPRGAYVVEADRLCGCGWLGSGTPWHEVGPFCPADRGAVSLDSDTASDQQHNGHYGVPCSTVGCRPDGPCSAERHAWEVDGVAHDGPAGSAHGAPDLRHDDPCAGGCDDPAAHAEGGR